jgi:hypothetical protein
MPLPQHMTRANVLVRSCAAEAVHMRAEEHFRFPRRQLSQNEKWSEIAVRHFSQAPKKATTIQRINIDKTFDVSGSGHSSSRVRGGLDATLMLIDQQPKEGSFLLFPAMNRLLPEVSHRSLLPGT